MLSSADVSMGSRILAIVSRRDKILNKINSYTRVHRVKSSELSEGKRINNHLRNRNSGYVATLLQSHMRDFNKF